MRPKRIEHTHTNTATSRRIDRSIDWTIFPFDRFIRSALFSPTCAFLHSFRIRSPVQRGLGTEDVRGPSIIYFVNSFLLPASNEVRTTNVIVMVSGGCGSLFHRNKQQKRSTISRKQSAKTETNIRRAHSVHGTVAQLAEKNWKEQNHSAPFFSQKQFKKKGSFQ